MTPLDYGKRAATIFNANNSGHFPGRPLFEGLVANAVRDAMMAEREAIARMVQALAGRREWAEEGEKIDAAIEIAAAIRALPEISSP